MIARGLLGAALSVAIVAACGGSVTAAGTPPPGAVIVTAVNLAFVPSSVTAPADMAFVLYFDNRDTVLHNARLVDAGGQTIVPGELFMGPSARIADVPALPTGTYRLLCDVHPDMVGELIAEGGAAPALSPPVGRSTSR